jgi:hypothetical protein
LNVTDEYSIYYLSKSSVVPFIVFTIVLPFFYCISKSIFFFFQC